MTITPTTANACEMMLPMLGVMLVGIDFSEPLIYRGAHTIFVIGVFIGQSYDTFSGANATYSSIPAARRCLNTAYQ
jgi:hypothetical protein